ncbi:MAG: BLUF domain-containing protein [Pseudomonadota bacterium]
MRIVVSWIEQMERTRVVFELVYCSVLSRMADLRNVADLVRSARGFNRDNGLTGILVFDGERFCQHLEGDREAVLLLVGKIARDKRHQQVNVLHQGFAGNTRRFADSPMSYALDSRGKVLESLLRARGPEVIALLQQQIGSLVLLP